MDNNPNNLQYDPNNAQYNPNNTQYNPNNTQYNPNNTQYNPNNTQYNPNNTQYNPNNTQYNPNNTQYNPNNTQYNPNNTQYSPNNASNQQYDPNRTQLNLNGNQYNQNTYQTGMQSTKSGNMGLGILGMVLGAAIGGALWVIVAQMGYIVAIIGFLMVVFAMKGYEILGKKQIDKTATIITLIVCMITIFAAEYIACAMIYHDELKGLRTFSDCLKDVWTILKNYDKLRVAFVRDLAIGYVFTIAASFSILKNGFKIKRAK